VICELNAAEQTVQYGEQARTRTRRLSVCSACALQVRTAVTRTLVRLFENDMLGALLEDTPAQQDAYNRSVSERAADL